MASKEEQVGFHRGSIAVLLREQQELMKMVNVIPQVVQIHIQALKELGVDYIAEIEKLQEEYRKKQATQKTSKDALADRLK